MDKQNVLKLTVENVQKVMLCCLWKNEDLVGVPQKEMIERSTVIEGLTRTFGFNPERVEEQRENIIDLLNQLPEIFHYEGGGGGSFLGACWDKNEKQWGQQIDAEDLMVLGIAISKVSYCLPREAWLALPGSVPYFVIE